MSGIGHQRCRIGDESIKEFNGHETAIERDRQNECPPIAERSRMMMPDVMMVMAMVMVPIVMMVGNRHEYSPSLFASPKFTARWQQ
jgi:hypothetical protein